MPCAHWIPPGALRRAYLRAFLTMRIGRRMPNMSVAESAREWDERLRLYTFYRFMNELEALFTYYFEEWAIDTGTYIDAKIDMLQESPSRLRRAAGRVLDSANGPLLTNLITYGFNAVFVARRPIPADRRASGRRMAALSRMAALKGLGLPRLGFGQCVFDKLPDAPFQFARDLAFLRCRR